MSTMISMAEWEVVDKHPRLDGVELLTLSDMDGNTTFVGDDDDAWIEAPSTLVAVVGEQGAVGDDT